MLGLAQRGTLQLQLVAVARVAGRAWPAESALDKLAFLQLTAADREREPEPERIRERAREPEHSPVPEQKAERERGTEPEALVLEPAAPQGAVQSAELPV
jgi:hypothetical protein